MSALLRSRPVRRSLRPSFLLLLATAFLPFAACGGGGGGSAPPGLQVGVDLNGPWSVTFTAATVTGTCFPTGNVSTNSMQLVHDRAAGSIVLANDLSGALRGLESTLRGVAQLGGSTIEYTAVLTFAADGTSFSGTLEMLLPGQSCTASGPLQGVRAMGYQVFPGPNDRLEYDEPIDLVFDRAVDPTTVDQFTIQVLDSRQPIGGTLTMLDDRRVRFVADELLPVDARIEVDVSDDVRAVDGRAAGIRPNEVVQTEQLSEFFRYRIESADGQVALDTQPSGAVTLSLPNLTAGQRWRFNRIGYGAATPVYLLRNDSFGSARALEGSDGGIDSLMLTYTTVPSGMAWFAPTRADGFRLHSALLPQSALTRTSELPGGAVRNQSGSGPEANWLLRPIERIGVGMPTIALNVGDRIQAALQSTDPVGLRSPTHVTNLYRFDLAFPATVTIAQRSNVFDSWLILLSDDTFDDNSLVIWQRSILAEDDDTGGTDLDALSIRDARLQMPMEPGRYFVAVTTFNSGDVGAYQLTATAVESGTQLPLVLMPGAASKPGKKAW